MAIHGKVSQHRAHRASCTRPGAYGLCEDNYTEHFQRSTPAYTPQLGQVTNYPDNTGTVLNRITWPYAPANVQEQVMNGWDGNQLPSPLKSPWGEGVIPTFYHATVQRQDASYAYSGKFGAQLSQIEARDILTNISDAWRNIRGG